MKANELRIGNIIHTPYDRYSIIDEVGYKDEKGYVKIKDKPMGYYLDFCNPIPLTEEWLLKMGFVSNPYQDRYELNGIYLECYKLNGFLQLWESRTGVDLKTVHQMQNLIYAITNEELTINL
jgi:hypothetical protein